jgi:hypothetical protein
MKARVIHTKFWEDNFVIQLNHKEKLAFLYFLTNARIGVTGIYELPDKLICSDLDITASELVEIKNLFTKADKIHFVDGFVIVRNSKKYNNFLKGSELQKKGFNREMELLPENIIEYLEDHQFQIILDWACSHKENKLVGN